MAFQRETDLYPFLKQHFQRQGYQVYAEVPAPHGGYVDLLAVRGERSLAVELKLRFSRLALRQASRNRRVVWQSYVALGLAPRLDRRQRSLFTRRGVGLLQVSRQEVSVTMPALEQAPPCTVREAFGPRLAGEVGRLHAVALGGVPTKERVSAWRALTERVERAIRGQGGVASTEQILEETLAWNYFRAKRAGLAALLAARFRSPAVDLWATPQAHRPAIHVVRWERLVRCQDRSIRVVLDEYTEPAARPGDVLWLVREGGIIARALLKFAGRYPVKATPQRELRAGPAIFSPWRLGGVAPREVIVAGWTAYRELPSPKAFPRLLKAPWQTIRPSSAAQR
jgi:hypothetical protein